MQYRMLPEKHTLIEEQLHQAQKMEAIGQLAGGVAHDFNNLLLVIHGNIELVLRNANPLDEQSRHCLQQATAASERAANLVRQLLFFSRKQAVQFLPVNLNDVIRNLSKMVNRIIGENISQKCNYCDRLPLVNADVGMIEQVLVNLIINARDAMPRGGTLTITTELVTLDTSILKTEPEGQAGSFVSVTVSDTGMGIPQEHMQRIFEPFFTTKEVGKGTGLVTITMIAMSVII